MSLRSRDENAPTMLTYDKPRMHEFVIGLHDCAHVDAQFVGQIANAGQLIALIEIAARNFKLHRLDNLTVDRFATVMIEMDPHSPVTTVVLLMIQLVERSFNSARRDACSL